jgi:hypothetical protein
MAVDSWPTTIVSGHGASSSAGLTNGRRPVIAAATIGARSDARFGGLVEMGGA